ncbi:MAG: hypothetical protein IJD38_04870, partial [Clostridia bacterium]|nr:hypothetical protein [Clostridia bacterium]
MAVSFRKVFVAVGYIITRNQKIVNRIWRSLLIVFAFSTFLINRNVTVRSIFKLQFIGALGRSYA